MSAVARAERDARWLSLHAKLPLHGESYRQLLKVAVGGQDLAVAVMVVPCLTVGEGVRLLADCGERDVVEEEPRGERFCRCSWHSRPDRS